MMTSPNRVRVWQERQQIPTYRVGQPDRNPMFLEKRVYQGSSGAVYPYPVIDQVADTATLETWTAVYLENRYLKIMILPELGGRVQMALDKTNGYHFIYYNQVIKPALVGLAGPWISGGIEFNWPQHHRPSTFSPLEWRIAENADGSRTVWCSEIERMFFTKGMHGFTLHPDRAYLEISVQLYNRSSEPQTFLWWANPAVHVNDDYQSVFPPDVHAVMDHGKRDVSAFPIATGTYYKVDYAPGTDISRYKNIPVPTSYMAYHSDFDFVGDYDHSRQAGMLHIANHHLVPGKKQWTWGNSEFGRAWDRQLQHDRLRVDLELVIRGLVLGRLEEEFENVAVPEHVVVLGAEAAHFGVGHLSGEVKGLVVPEQAGLGPLARVEPLPEGRELVDHLGLFPNLFVDDAIQHGCLIGASANGLARDRRVLLFDRGGKRKRRSKNERREHGTTSIGEVEHSGPDWTEQSAIDRSVEFRHHAPPRTGDR